MRKVSDFILKKLIEIGGYAEDGRTPNLRFGHGTEITEFARGTWVLKYPINRQRKITSYKTMAFNGTGMPGDILLETKFITVSAEESQEKNEYGYLKYPLLIPNYEIVYEGEPVWILEGWLSAVKFRDSWERMRFKYDPVTNELVDILGEPPENGGYDFIKRMNGTHGAPNYPGPLNDDVINYVQMLWNKAEHDNLFKQFDWRNEKAPDKVVMQLEVQEKALEKEAMDREAIRIEEEIKNVYSPAIKWLRDERSSFGSGKIFTGIEEKV